MGIEQWSQTPGSNTNANTGINWDEGMAPSAVNDSARSTMAAVREWYDDAEWLKYGENGSANAFSISFVSATVFKFASTDRRSLAPVGRRVKAGVGAGLIYGTVTDSSLSASDTQITVSWDSGQLDGSLSFVSLGILSPTSDSHPRNMDMSFSDVSVSGVITGNPDASLSDVSAATIAGAVVATQAQMEAGSATNLVVTPGRQHLHPSAAKAWASWTSAGVIRSSFNVTSITDNNTGDHTVNYTASFSTSDYVALGTAQIDPAATNGTALFIQTDTSNKAKGSTRVYTLSAGTLNVSDADIVHFAAFGDRE